MPICGGRGTLPPKHPYQGKRRRDIHEDIDGYRRKTQRLVTWRRNCHALEHVKRFDRLLPLLPHCSTLDAQQHTLRNTYIHRMKSKIHKAEEKTEWRALYDFAESAIGKEIRRVFKIWAVDIYDASEERHDSNRNQSFDGIGDWCWSEVVARERENEKDDQGTLGSRYVLAPLGHFAAEDWTVTPAALAAERTSATAGSLVLHRKKRMMIFGLK
jgi:hypothetical protein